jgi:outer membrane protein OmpA-like peptidoglycan-associated protein
MKRIDVLLIIIASFASLQLAGQNKTEKYFNFDELESSQLIPLESINTDLIEFAPFVFDNGILFVQGNTEKKRIKSGDAIYFRLMQAGGNLAEGFGQAEIFEGIHNDGVFDGPACYLPAQKTLAVTKNQHTVLKGEEFDEKKLGIYFYKYSEIDSNWVLTGEFNYNNNGYNICHPAWDEQNEILYFASDMPGGFGRLDLYMVQKNQDNSWSMPINLGININSPANDCFPYFFNDKFLFYSSDRSTSKGGLDIFASAWNGEGWLNSIGLPGEINSVSDDLGLVSDSEGLQLFFSSSRPGGEGNDDLYGIRLEKPLINLAQTGQRIAIINHKNNAPLDKVEIVFYKFQTRNIRVQSDSTAFESINYEIDKSTLKASKPVYTDFEGMVIAALDPGDYIIQARKDKFHPLNELISIDSDGGFFEFGMDSIVCNPITLIIRDSDTGSFLSGTAVSINNDQNLLTSDQAGSIKTCVHQAVPLHLKIQKGKYQPYELIIKFEETSPNEEIVVALRPEEIFVSDLPVFSGEYTVLENILYGYDKFNLNAAAKEELDRLAKHMMKYPAISIELSAHTDSRGGEVYNQLLSDKRASEAKQYLIGKGIEAVRIAAIGYGESRLKNKCGNGVTCEEALHAENRRTEVRVLAATGNQ